MVEVLENLFVGTAEEYESNKKKFDSEGWSVVHACKEPYHRRLLNYTGRAAPKEHPEYLFAERENRLFMNLIDPDNSAYIPESLVNKAVDWMAEKLESGQKVFVHCNKGESRAPSLALLYMRQNKNANDDLPGAIKSFKEIYPDYQPSKGMSDFVDQHWSGR